MSFSAHYLSSEPSRAQIEAWPDALLLEFGAPWCGHCKAVQPQLRAALEEHAEIAHLKVEDGKGRPLGRSFRVKLWPTLVFLRQGQEVARLVRPTHAAAIREALAALA